ncbi:hypothetical protein N7481_000021 [Penicillium waksmanii]|uniref:uncharacterized protein n=1 Tax=Penicillium waksmanii TaxID=69791 RepID=UPI00254737A7|nr:uncharacterized protein N7481_000021 [Penicillium waksmanii]KAJ5999612.1 hypothetical protein N7481_000021 [Penicillium waksmanii]
MKKAFTFLPGHRSNRQDSESGDTSSTLFKRREQLRKAQRTHRLRKDQYFKNLESEVLRLRTNEVNLVIQVQKLRNQVDELQGIVDIHEQSRLSVSFCGLKQTENIGADPTAVNTLFQSHCGVKHGISSWGPEAGMGFEGTDSLVDPSSKTLSNHMMLDQSPNPHDQLVGSTNSQQPDPYFRPPTLTPPAQQTGSQSRCFEHPFKQRMTDMGMEFVLALEQPCLPHLERQPDKSNGHALLASATLVHPHKHLYTPSTLSKHASSPQSPAFIFDKLLALSEELVLDDELSPTQAWCHIVQQSWANKLDSAILRELSASLFKLIKCHGFGAVMRRDAFEAILVQTSSTIS